MYYGRDFPSADPTTIQRYSFDFAPQIPELDSLASVVWGMEVAPSYAYQETDADADTRHSNPQEAGSEVFIVLSTMVANCRYKVVATVTTVNGLVVDYFAFIVCNQRPLQPTA